MHYPSGFSNWQILLQHALKANSWIQSGEYRLNLTYQFWSDENFFTVILSITQLLLSYIRER